MKGGASSVLAFCAVHSIGDQVDICMPGRCHASSKAWHLNRTCSGPSSSMPRTPVNRDLLGACSPNRPPLHHASTPCRRWPNIEAWFEALEKRPTYLGTRSDFYTHVHDLPPQLGGLSPPLQSA